MSNVWATGPLEQISTNLTEFELQQNASNTGEPCRLRSALAGGLSGIEGCTLSSWSLTGCLSGKTGFSGGSRARSAYLFILKAALDGMAIQRSWLAQPSMPAHSMPVLAVAAGQIEVGIGPLLPCSGNPSCRVRGLSAPRSPPAARTTAGRR